MGKLCFTGIFYFIIFISNVPLHASVNVNFADYQPLSVGSYWILEDEFNNSYRHEIIGTEIIDGKVTYQYTDWHGNPVYANLRHENGALVEAGLNGIPQFYHPWVIDGVDIDNEYVHIVYEMIPQITVPAGTFYNVVKETHYSKYNSTEVISRIWYFAPNVGLIMDVNYCASCGGTYTFTAKLTSYKINKNIVITPILNLLLRQAGDGTVVSAGQTWMDRNLGATLVATSMTDAEAYGDLYQWGRLTDGHEQRTSPTTPTLSTTDIPGHGSFILTSSSPWDWRSPQNDNLWQGVAGINNPCPAGFRLPTAVELNTERLSWSTNNSAGAFASPLKLVPAGYRIYSDGALSSAGSVGGYLSSTVDGSDSRYLNFFSVGANMNSGNRAFGFSVRCLKD